MAIQVKSQTHSMTIPDLHSLYCSLTGRDLTLDYLRGSCWSVWLKYRKHEPFTEGDLKLVIRFLKHQILKGERKPSYLHFNNLIASPDWFEETLQDARGWARRPATAPAKASVLRATGRAPERTHNDCKSARELIPSLVDQMRKAVNDG